MSIALDPRLGRQPEFDPKSRAYSMAIPLNLPERRKAVTKVWDCPVWLDQGQEGACVGFSFSHELAAAPDVVEGVTNESAQEVFKLAKQLDQWPGEAYDWTSVLAGIKAVEALYPEVIASYRWCFSLEDLVQTISFFGPVVLGINWYSGMHRPNVHGLIKRAGRVTGGHAILARGVDVVAKTVLLRNSWGRSWGKDGDCVIGYADLNKLLHEDGEACVPLRPAVTKQIANLLCTNPESVLV
jgi:hypothetical protein